MQRPPAPVFGKRNAVADARASVFAAPPRAPMCPQAESRATEASRTAPERDTEDDETSPRVVPRSRRAAILAGLVVGFFLAGQDITHAGAPDPALVPLLQLGGFDGTMGARAVPTMIVLSLLSGARIAAMTLLLLHRLLAWAGQSSHAAYAVGGATVTAVYAAVVMALGHPPEHGWPVDIAAGAGAGFFYRMFAGARPVARDL